MPRASVAVGLKRWKGTENLEGIKFWLSPSAKRHPWLLLKVKDNQTAHSCTATSSALLDSSCRRNLVFA